MLGSIHVRLTSSEAADGDAFRFERFGFAVDGEGERWSEFLNASSKLHVFFRRGERG